MSRLCVGLKLTVLAHRGEKMSDLREFADKWCADYRKRWAETPYGGPSEPNPTELEGIVNAFIEAYEKATP
jgi:hypothetical protein